MKKILFVINTMGQAGAETALITLIKALLKKGGYDISLLAIIPRGELFAAVPPQVHILNRHYSASSVFSTGGRLAIAAQAGCSFLKHGHYVSDLAYFRENIQEQKTRGQVHLDKVLWRLLADTAPRQDTVYDLAVSYLEGAAVYYVADHVKAKKKAGFIHIDYQQAGYTPAMDRDCFDALEKIFVVSKEVGSKFCQVYPRYAEKVELFYNLLDPDEIRRKAQQPGFTDGYTGTRLVTVGRLHYQKGYDIAIEACARLRADGYAIRWYVIGEGSERQKLEKLIHSYDMASDFVLMGLQKNPYPYVDQADIYVHATRFEGKSIAIEEAQILGKPIVASNCTGNTEQIRDGIDGILLELNVENLAAALKKVLDDPQLRSRLSAAVSQKSWEDANHLYKLTALLED